MIPNLGTLGTSLRTVANISSLSAIPDTIMPDGSLVFVASQGPGLPGQIWVLDRQSSATPDGITVSVTQSGLGKWIYWPVSSSGGNGSVSLKSFGSTGNGIADDSAALTKGSASLANTGLSLWVPAATYRTSNPVIPSSGESVSLGAGVNWITADTPSGIYTGSGVLYSEPTEIDNGTIVANVQLGQTTLLANFVATVPSPGQFVRLVHADSSQTFLLEYVVNPGAAVSGTVAVNNGSTSITFSGNQTMSAGDLLIFSSQQGVYYALSGNVSASTSGTLTAAFTGTNASAATATRVATLSGTFSVTGPTSTTQGSAVVPTTASQVGTVSVGDLVQFTSQLNTFYTVKSVSASQIVLTSPYTGTTATAAHCSDMTKGVSGGTTVMCILERPILLPFTTSDSIVCYASTLQDWAFDGKNMQMGGTGDLYFELFGVRRCTIENVRVNTSLGSLRPSTFAMSFDIGGYQNRYRRMYIDGTGAANSFSGPTEESGEDCLMEDVMCTNVSGNGPGLVDSINSVLHRIRTKNAPNGFGQGFGSQDVGSSHSFGCKFCISNDGLASGCLYGFEDNGPTGGFTEDSRLNRFKATGCQTGIWATSTSSGLVANGVVTEASVIQGILLQSQGPKGTVIRDWTANEQAGASNCATVAANTTQVLFDGCNIITGGIALTGCGFDISGTRTTIRDTVINVATSSRIAIIWRSGTLILDNVQVGALNGATTIYGLFATGSGGTAYIRRSCDFSACTTPVSPAAGFTINVEQAGVVAINTTTAMTFSQLQNAEVESSGNSSGTVTITASVAIPGMQWTFRNNNTSTSTTTFMGITVAVGKTAIIRINSAGSGERVTADT